MNTTVESGSQKVNMLMFRKSATLVSFNFQRGLLTFPFYPPKASKPELQQVPYGLAPADCRKRISFFFFFERHVCLKEFL